MRHIRSILYSLVLAPAAWVLTAVGLTGDLTARGRDGFAVENFTGLLLLLLAGAAYGILVLGPFSPAGPLSAGVVYLAISGWALTSPAAYADIWPPAVAKDGFDLSRPGYGLAAILAVPLICTALSARRWAKYEPPVLPLIGPIGRARGAAAPQGMPLSIAQTTVIGTVPSTTTDPEPTTVLRLNTASASSSSASAASSSDSMTAVVPAALAAPDSTTAVVPPALAAPDSTTAVVPATLAAADSTTAVVSAAPAAPLDDDPTIVWAVPAALAAITAAGDEDTVASTHTPPVVDEPPTVIDVSAGEPTEAVTTEEPTEPVTVDEPTQFVAVDEPAEAVAEDQPEDAAAEALSDGDPTEAVVEEEPTSVIAESKDEEVPEPTPAADKPEAADDEITVESEADGEPEEPAAVVDEAAESEAALGDADDEATVAAATTDEVLDEDEETVAAPVAGADRTEVIRLPVADNGEKTQVVRLPVAENGERTQVVRLPATEVVPFPVADPEEKTQVIRLPQVLQFPVRSAGAEPGQRTRDLSDRATGDVGGDETQVIRLAGKTVDDEKTQVIRPALVTRPPDRTDEPAFRAPKLRDATPPPDADAEPTAPIAYPEAARPATMKAPLSIADAEAPNFADDPTSPITLVSRNGVEPAEAPSRSMTVMKMERPPDDAGEETTHLEIPAQRRPGAEE